MELRCGAHALNHHDWEDKDFANGRVSVLGLNMLRSFCDSVNTSAMVVSRFLSQVLYRFVLFITFIFLVFRFYVSDVFLRSSLSSGLAAEEFAS